METSTALKLEHCRSCQAPIYWLKHTVTGKAAPIDAALAPDGNILIEPERGAYHIIPKAARVTFAGELRTNHFVTCPQAKAWAHK